MGLHDRRRASARPYMRMRSQEGKVRDGDMGAVVSILREECPAWKPPIVTEISRDRDPYKVLISCMISLRTKDDVTREASRRLFRLARTPAGMARLSAGAIEGAIYPAGFYRVKARSIAAASALIVERYGGEVPDEIDRLLELPGVGRKTANLVLTLGFGKPGICVDTHVHRIMNRLGYVATKTPGETELALRGKLPPEHWIEINDLLVTFGQNLCTPLSPFCSRCRLDAYCGRVGVRRSR